MLTRADLTDRMADPKGSDKALAEIRRMKGKETEAERDLKSRLATAREIRPPKEAHCGCCFGQGRDAAIRAIEGAPEEG